MVLVCLGSCLLVSVLNDLTQILNSSIIPLPLINSESLQKSVYTGI